MMERAMLFGVWIFTFYGFLGILVTALLAVFLVLIIHGNLRGRIKGRRQELAERSPMRKIQRAVGETDPDLAAAIVLHSHRKLMALHAIGMVPDFNDAEESVPCEAGENFLVRLAEDGCLYFADYYGDWSIDGEKVEILSWSKFNRMPTEGGNSNGGR